MTCIARIQFLPDVKDAKNLVKMKYETFLVLTI